MPNFMDELLRLTGQYQDPFKRAAGESPFREADRSIAGLFGNTRDDARQGRSMGLANDEVRLKEQLDQYKKQLGQLRNLRASQRSMCLQGDKSQCAMADSTEDKMKWIEKEIEKLEEELKTSKTNTESSEDVDRGGPMSAGNNRGSYGDGTGNSNLDRRTGIFSGLRR